MTPEAASPGVHTVDRLVKFIFKEETFGVYVSNRVERFELNEHEEILVSYFASNENRSIRCLAESNAPNGGSGLKTMVLEFVIGNEGLRYLRLGGLQARFDSLRDEVALKGELTITGSGPGVLTVDEPASLKFSAWADRLADYTEEAITKGFLPNVPFGLDVKPWRARSIAP